MSQSASQAAIFYSEVAKQGFLFTIYDEGGYPAPKNKDGIRSQPFWSSESRIKRLAKICEAYSSFKTEKINWENFKIEWIPKLEKNNLLVGINWSGSKAIGYDIKPQQIVKNVEFYMQNNKDI